jgi:hypothetical protein
MIVALHVRCTDIHLAFSVFSLYSLTKAFSVDLLKSVVDHIENKFISQ